MEVLVPLIVVVALLLLIVGSIGYVTIVYIKATLKDRRINNKRKKFKVVK